MKLIHSQFMAEAAKDEMNAHLGNEKDSVARTIPDNPNRKWRGCDPNNQ